MKDLKNLRDEILTKRQERQASGEDLGQKQIGSPPGFEGTGISIDSLINRLEIGLGSIKAGNSSLKLRKEIETILNLLHANKIISSEQRKKLFPK